MAFIDDVKKFGEKASTLINSIASEEATKTALIMPFFQQILGYDVFSPIEFIPEYGAGFGDKPSGWVDYTIVINGKAEIAVECKCVNVKLDNQHIAQLQGYYASLPVKFAVLTNGIVYQFFTDIELANILDKTPFMTLDIISPDPSVVAELERFKKDRYNSEEIFANSRQLKYKNAIKKYLSEQLTDPSDTFVKAVISNIDEVDMRGEAVEEMRPLVKRCFAEFISEQPRNKIAPESAEEPSANYIEQEVLDAIRECVKDVIEPARLSLYIVTKWTSVYYRNCMLCKIFTIGKEYCELAFPQKFTDPKTNWKNRKIAIYYTLSCADEVANYRDDFLASAKDIDASYGIMHNKKSETI